MFVAIRYMQDEINAIAELVGPFDGYLSSDAWIIAHWGDYDPRDCESYPVAPPEEAVTAKESDNDDQSPF
jgi:hypothetical protein